VKKLLPTCLLVCALSGAAVAVVFDFIGNVALYTALDVQTGPVSFTNGSVVATFTASDGVMNRTASSFGLNSNISGDDTDAFDKGEWIDITFESVVTLTHVDVSSWNAGEDQATISLEEISIGLITSTGSHSFNIGIATGKILRISSTAGLAGNGWSLKSIAVQTGIITPTNTPPVLASIGNPSLTVSNALSFSVTASDADNDLVILSASNLPPGAVFNTVSNTGSVTGQFDWVSAEPIGVHTPAFYATDGTTNDSEEITITVTNASVMPPPTATVWRVIWNEPQQSSSGAVYPNQFQIRNALVARIDELHKGHSAMLSTFTFSADEGAGRMINAMNSALDRGAEISFIADSEAEIAEIHGGTNSLLSLKDRPVNPLHLVVDDSGSGIMHNKFALFDYGGANQMVLTGSWNHTLSASANQWNITLEIRSPSLYAVYTSEAAELLAGRFHDNPNKSHTHDESTFTLDGSWGANFVRFAPYPDDTPGGNNAERDISNLIDLAKDEIVFVLNKLNREPIRDALVDAANRGVIIQGVMPKSDTDPGEVSFEVYSYLTNSANYATTNIVQFLPAFAKADYSKPDDGELNLIHAKTIVIDPDSSNAVVIHGSANWTHEALVSDTDNDENTLVLRHNAIAAELRVFFERITGTGTFGGGNSVIAEWNFEGTNGTSGGIDANETKTVVCVPAPSSYDAFDGDISCNGWNNGANTACWKTSVSTKKHTEIKVSSIQTASSTGPSDFKLQYKIGAAGTYADITNAAIEVPNGGKGVLTRVSLPATCENQTAVFLRWIMTSNISARHYDDVQAGGKGRVEKILITGLAYNQPPVLDPMSEQNVFENDSLIFTVTADDPVDGDPVTITAENLPTGALFSNGVFTWNHAVPVGAYAVTFTATDKDGSVSETLTLTVLKRPELLISEIADPSGTGADVYRFAELHNAGANAIDLGAERWHLCLQKNGGTSWTDIPLTGTIPVAGTCVIANSQNDFETAYGLSPDLEDAGIDGNGDDAYFLYRGGDHTDGLLIDIYGEENTAGTGTDWEYTDSRVERNENVLNPNNIWTVTEWIISSGTSIHDMTPGKHGPRPQFKPLEDLFVFLGDDLALPVTAFNLIRSDVITLSATNLPTEAAFPTAIGVDTVTGTLNWNSPAAGVYTITFMAKGLAGIRNESVKITVSSTTKIDGYFYGWKPDTIAKLKNGQFWRNIGGTGSTVDPRLRNPEATITNKFGNHVMVVEGVTGDTEVERIEIAESTVNIAFTGLHYGNIYQLEDGTMWEQIDFENISSAASPVTAWRWIESGKTYLRFLGRNNVIIGTAQVVASGGPVNPPIISQIDGWFRGWKNKRVFALKNGQFWQQVDIDSSTETLYQPDITITNWLLSGIWRMQVNGAITPPAWIEVQQLDNVARTTIDGWFYGFGRHHIYHLSDGSWWQQTSLHSSASTRSNPGILIWRENGTDVLEMPDEGRTITAKELTVLLDGTVTNRFTGLLYGNEYQLENTASWLQISFEKISSEENGPDAMIWVEEGQTNMLLRSKSDKPIGTCTVVDPQADVDGDQMSSAAEIIAGSDPLDKQSIFEIIETTRDDTGRTVLHWNAIETRIYRVEWTPRLTEPFQPLEDKITFPQNNWTDTVHAVETKGFYLIRVRLAN